jgi:hypothetical protein
MLVRLADIRAVYSYYKCCNVFLEHRRLLATIREAAAEARTEPRDRLLLRAQVRHFVACLGAAGRNLRT